LLAKPGTNFNADAFSQNKTPAVPELRLNLDSPQVGRAADAQMFFYLILATCGVGFLALVVFSATQSGKQGGVKVHRSVSDEEDFLPGLLQRRRRRRRHSSHHVEAPPRVQM
jgi:hypothetical protein